MVLLNAGYTWVSVSRTALLAGIAWHCVSPAWADEAAVLLGPEQLNPVIQEIIDESNTFDNPSATIKGAPEAGNDGPERGKKKKDESDFSALIMKQLLPGVEKDVVSDSSQSAGFGKMQITSDVKASESNSLATKIETKVADTIAKSLSGATDGAASGTGTGGTGTGTGAGTGGTTGTGRTPGTAGAGTNIPSPDGSRPAVPTIPTTSTAGTNIIARISDDMNKGINLDPDKLSPKINEADRNKQMSIARKNVEDAISKAGIDPKHPDISSLLNAFDPKFDDKAKNIIAQNGQKAFDNLDVTVAKLNTGSLADKITTSIQNKDAGIIDPSDKINIDDIGVDTKTSNINADTDKDKFSINQGADDGKGIDADQGDDIKKDTNDISDKDLKKKIDDKLKGRSVTVKGPNASDIPDPTQKDGNKFNDDFFKKAQAEASKDGQSDGQTAPSVSKDAIDQKVDKSLAGLSKSLSNRLNDVEKIIKQKTSDAFDQIQAQLKPQIDKANADYAAKLVQAQSITVPPVKQDKHTTCVLHVIICVKHATSYTPNPKSEAEHIQKQTEKDVAEGQAKAAKEEYEKLKGASDAINSEKGKSLDQITKAFENAQNVVVSVGDNGTVSTSDKQGASPDAPQDTSKDKDTVLASSVWSSDAQPTDLTVIGTIDEWIMANALVAAAIGDDSIAREDIAMIGNPEGGKETIEGNVTAEVFATGLVDASIGYASEADTDVASVEGDLDGSLHQHIIATGAVNAAIGSQSLAVLEIGNTRGKLTGTESQTVDATGFVNAAIGNKSVAYAKIGNIEASTKALSTHGVTLSASAPLAVNASIGNNTTSHFLVGNVDGVINGATTHKASADGAISAAIGDNSNALISVGNVSGTLGGKFSNKISVVGGIAAAIGEKTTAEVSIGNVGSEATLHSSGSINVSSAGAIAAAIGYNSTSDISVGNIRADIRGSTKMNITTGPLIAASLGADTGSYITVGDVNEKIMGSLDMNITAGEITSFAIGGNARSEAIIGTVGAPIHGNVSMDITTGAVFVGAIGYKNKASTYVGYIEPRDDGQPYTGNVDMNITVGDINNFSIGIGADNDSIDSRISIGSILSNSTTNGLSPVKVSKGSVTAFSFGFDFDIPLLGDYFIGERGCQAIGDIGGTDCSGSDNHITIERR